MLTVQDYYNVIDKHLQKNASPKPKPCPKLPERLGLHHRPPDGAATKTGRRLEKSFGKKSKQIDLWADWVLYRHLPLSRVAVLRNLSYGKVLQTFSAGVWAELLSMSY